MEEIKNTTFSEKDMKAIVEEVQPIMDSLSAIIDKYNMEGFISVTVWDDGESYVTGSGLAGWSINKDCKGFYSINYTYNKQLAKEGGEKDE